MVASNPNPMEAATEARQVHAQIRAVVPARLGGWFISYALATQTPSRAKNGDIYTPSDTATLQPMGPECVWVKTADALAQLGLNEAQLRSGQEFILPSELANTT